MNKTILLTGTILSLFLSTGFQKVEKAAEMTKKKIKDTAAKLANTHNAIAASL